jgi:hypothetical protein
VCLCCKSIVLLFDWLDLQSRMQSREVESIQLRRENQQLINEITRLQLQLQHQHQLPHTQHSTTSTLTNVSGDSRSLAAVNVVTSRELDAMDGMSPISQSSSMSWSSDNNEAVTTLAPATHHINTKVVAAPLPSSRVLPSTSLNDTKRSSAPSSSQPIPRNTNSVIDTTSTSIANSTIRQLQEEVAQLKRLLIRSSTAISPSTASPSSAVIAAGKGSGKKKKTGRKAVTTGKQHGNGVAGRERASQKIIPPTKAASTSFTSVPPSSATLLPTTTTPTGAAPMTVWPPLIASSLMPSRIAAAATNATSAATSGTRNYPFVRSAAATTVPPPTSTSSSTTTTTTTTTRTSNYGPNELHDVSYDNDTSSMPVGFQVHGTQPPMSPLPVWPLRKSDSMDEPLNPPKARKGVLEYVVA